MSADRDRAAANRAAARRDAARAAGQGSAYPIPTRAALDVHDLPTVTFGHRDVMWWGTNGFVIVETMTLAATVASYFYLRRNFDAWPPTGTPYPSVGIPTLNLVLLLLSIVPYYLLEKAAKKLDRDNLVKWLWVSVAFSLVTNVLRGFEIAGLNTRWNSNAYGSVVWAVVITHTTLLVTDLFETLVLATIFARKREQEKHYPDASDNSLYSYFMILVWVPLYVIVYWVPRW